MAYVYNASEARLEELAVLIDDEAEAVLKRAEALQVKADALHRAAELLFKEADRLDPFVGDRRINVSANKPVIWSGLKP